MEKFARYAPLFLFCCYVLKIGITGASFTDAPVLFILGTLSAFIELDRHSKYIKGLETRVEKMGEVILAQAKAHDELKTHVSSLKLQTSMRPIANPPSPELPKRIF